MTFSSNHHSRTYTPAEDEDDDDDDDDDDDAMTPKNRGSVGGEYDSDEEDAILASGDALSVTQSSKSRNNNHEDDTAMHRSKLEIEEAKRRRGKVRRNQDGSDADFDNDHDMFDDDKQQHGGGGGESLSLITDRDADPDSYQSNAGGNASCPVEPFNMDAEKEGGMGYFDGDTYVFRQGKLQEGEEDAWLDGVEEENEEGVGGGGASGGLDSTSIWKPSEGGGRVAKGGDKGKKAKFVREDATPDEIGRRVVTLLINDDETVMMALTRHGSSLREMQARIHKMEKRIKLKKRKSSKNNDDASDKPAASEGDDEMKQIKSQMEQTRTVVEELTELADALLFEGETDAYELTKADWTHRFKLASVNGGKRSSDDVEAGVVAKKARHDYFGEAGGTADTFSTHQVAAAAAAPPSADVMWEYKGNEDGAIHGPYTSRQMMEWTSCGYFVGESAVDIRRVESTAGITTADAASKAESKETDVDDLMADLLDDDDEEGDTKEEASGSAAAHGSSWMRSDRVDFSLYL